MPGEAVYGFAFIAVAAWIGLFYVVIYRTNGALPAARPRRVYRKPSRFAKEPAPDLTLAAQQLSAVMAAPFEKQKVLSWPEYKVFSIIEDVAVTARRGHRVYAQTSLGEILSSPSDDAFRSINSKRVDILVVDCRGWPALAVEYQGNGHYQGSAAARDAIKREALRKAGVRYLEVFEDNSPEQIRSVVREHLEWETDHDPSAPR